MTFHTKTLLTALTTAAMIAGPTHAATITIDADVEIADSGSGENGNYNLSVFDNQFSYTPSYTDVNTHTTTDIGGTIVDYRFYGTSYDATAGGPVTVATSGGRSSNATTSDTSLSARSNARLWTTNDPNLNDWDTAPNFNGTGVGFKALQADLFMSFDISGLDQGTVYIVHGTINGGSNLFATMSGTGLSDLTSESITTGDINGTHKVSSFNFVNDAGYEDIVVTLDVTGGGPALMVGTVLVDTAAIPEPGSLALLGLGGLLIARRRRQG